MSWVNDLPKIAETIGADTILQDGKIITVDEKDTIAQALAIKYGRIAYVGTNEGVKRYIGKQTKLISLNGRCVTPGLITSHEHFLRYGLNALFGIDLWYPKVKSIQGIVDAVSEKARETPKGEWIFGWGWDENLLEEKRYPNRWDLDKAAPDNPVYLGRVYQKVAANSLALKLAGVNRDTPDPEYGKVYKDENGEPTGVFLTILPSANPFEDMMPKITTEKKEEAIVKACHDYNAEGMTTVVDAVVGAAEPDDLVAYENTRMRGELTTRVYALYGFVRTAQQAKETIQHISTYGDDMFKVGGVKLSLDGGVVPKTGYFYEPYVGEPENYGRTKWKKEDLMEAIRLFHDAGFQTCTHTIGDRAIDWVLDGIENAMKLNPRPDPRHQIIHIYYPTPEAIDRVKRLGVMANVQSTFIHFEGDTYIRFLGEERGACVKPLKTFISKGIPVGNSHDYPSGPINARIGLWAAVTRETFEGNVICPEERITVQEALRTYTIWNAKHLFMEDRIGSLEPGKYADLVVWDTDLYSAPTEKLKDIKVETTMLNGEFVYKAPWSQIKAVG
jgi:predicted amidohydrolase YtcJ